MHEGHKSMDPVFSREAAAILAVRGSRKVQGTGYQLNRDLLLKAVRHTHALCKRGYSVDCENEENVIYMYLRSKPDRHYMYMHIYTCIYFMS